MMHTTPAPGRWTYCLDPRSDTSTCDQFFDTKDEARAVCYVDLMGIWNDEPCAYVVRVDKVVSYALVARNLAQQFASDMNDGDLDSRICEDEELGCDGPMLSRVSMAEERPLRDFLAGWLESHGLVPMLGWWQYDDLEAVEREQQP